MYTYTSSSKRKIKRGRSPSLHLAKEGAFERNNSLTYILSSNIQIRVEIDHNEIFAPFNGLKYLMWCIIFNYCTLHLFTDAKHLHFHWNYSF